jgi:hypothetical protein
MKDFRLGLSTLLVLLLGIKVNAQETSIPLLTWYEASSSNKVLGKIWAVSGSDTANSKTVVDLRKDLGWRCQSLKPCTIPQGYKRATLSFNCLTKEYPGYGGSVQNLGDSVGQYNFVAWEVFSVACPRWSNQVQQLRDSHQLSSEGFTSRD